MKDIDKFLKKINKRIKNHRLIKDKWELGEPHHPLSVLLVSAISKIGWEKFDDFDIPCGGDGDLGETLMYILDAYFEELGGIEDLKEFIAKEDTKCI